MGWCLYLYHCSENRKSSLDNFPLRSSSAKLIMKTISREIKPAILCKARFKNSRCYFCIRDLGTRYIFNLFPFFSGNSLYFCNRSNITKLMACYAERSLLIIEFVIGKTRDQWLIYPQHY